MKSPFGELELVLTNVGEDNTVDVTNRLSNPLIDFGATGVYEIYQNLRFIMTTAYYSVVLDREFGFDMTIVDKPKPVAKLVLPQEVAMKIALYEPDRIFFEDVSYTEDLEGKLNPRVKARIVVTTYRS
ncbi:MAG TPA: hypothetical protein VNZ45_01595 [Bacteroidia bacterium]|jgi:phage baseplate assembly protein W|nr:hypothetical protein [Bacteroidia bacterium]